MGFVKVQGHQITPKPFIISAKIVFTLVENSTVLEPVIIKLVSSACNINIAFLEVIKGKSFINNKKNKGPRIDPCGTPCLTISQSE
jgi:hypothetical protein